MLKESLKQREQRKGYMTTCPEEHITHLKEEIEIIKTRLQPHDTGHLHDYIANMERRIEELNDNEE